MKKTLSERQSHHLAVLAKHDKPRDSKFIVAEIYIRMYQVKRWINLLDVGLLDRGVDLVQLVQPFSDADSLLHKDIQRKIDRIGRIVGGSVARLSDEEMDAIRT